MSESRRRPRFRRAPIRRFRLTERDREILRQVDDHRLLDSQQIVELVGDGSPQQIRRRLQLLFHHGLLDRPMEQLLSLEPFHGTRPIVYGLTRAGTRLLGAPPEGPRLLDGARRSARRESATHFQHTLLVASILAAIELACRRRPGVRFVPWREIVQTQAPESTRRRRRPGAWRVRLSEGTSIGVEPDAIFALHFAARPAGRDRAYFFLEADRATMPIARHGLRRTSVRRKLIAYQATTSQRLHQHQFGFPNFRVLTVTTSPREHRLSSLIEATSQLPGPHGAFLFATESAFAKSDPLTMEWRNGRGEVVHLLDGDLAGA